MKKLFLLIPLFLFSLLANATDREIGSSTTNILSATIEAATSGDVIILTDEGPYVNAYGVGYHELDKNLTIKAAEGVTPVVKIEVPFRITNGATVKFIGIKFDGSSIDHYDFLFRYYSTDATNLEFEDCEFTSIGKYIFEIYKGKSANSLVIKNCNFHDVSSRGVLVRGAIEEINISGSEFSNFTGYPIIHNYETGSIGKIKISDSEFKNNSKYLINGEATTHADSCIITNCYFHNNARSAIFFNASSVEGTETCDGVIVKNTTFANNDMSASDGSVIEVRNYGSTVASNIEVTVDHCTFYNNPTSADGYAGIRSYKSTKLNVTNCIFAHPTSYAKCATYCYGGNVTNCLAYNLTSGTNGHHSGPTLTGNFTADPLFTDAANGDFSLIGNWVTPSISPARGAATDGSNLGDPRWYTAETLPSTDFASAYTFDGPHARLSGRIALNGDNNLASSHNSEEANGVAVWKIHATKAILLQATLNMAASTSGHLYQVEIFNANDERVGSPLAEPKTSWTGSADITLPGTILLPEAGDYKIKLSNSTLNSEAVLESVTLSYAGGDVVEVPANSLGIADALFSNDCKREDGVIKFPSTAADVPNAWVKWNITVTDEAFYNVAVNIKNQYEHNITVTFYEEDEITVVGSVSEGENKSTADNVTGHAINLLGVYLKAGNYVAKLTNARTGSDAKIMSVAFAAADGGAVQNLPCTMGVNDAWFTCGATRADGQITYSSWNEDNSWIKWNAATSDDIFCNVKVSLSTTNAHRIYVAIYENEDEEPVATLSEAYSETIGDPLVRFLGRVYLPGGKNYVIKVTNPVGGSAAKINSVIFEEVVTPTVTLPGTLLPQDAMLSERATIDGDSLLFTARGDEGHNSSEWAKWKIRSESRGIYNFTLHAYNAAPASAQRYILTVLSNDESTEIETKTSAWDNKNNELTATLSDVELAAGNYIVKIQNPEWGSKGRVLDIEVTRKQITIDEEETNVATVIGAYDGKTVNAQLSRAFVQGMYNTICLPFDVPAAELARVFPGAKVKELASSSIESDGYILNLNFDDVTSLEAGKPYLIWPVGVVENPTFQGVTIDQDLNPSQTTNADFIGNVVVSQVPAGADNFFLGADNKLYYSSNATDINGMRAYIKVKNVSGSNAPTRARIIEKENVVTEIEIVGDSQPAINNHVRKAVKNGQLLIIKNGAEYNTLGVRVK